MRILSFAGLDRGVLEQAAVVLGAIRALGSQRHGHRHEAMSVAMKVSMLLCE
jgi:hypothetical protein